MTEEGHGDLFFPENVEDDLPTFVERPSPKRARKELVGLMSTFFSENPADYPKRTRSPKVRDNVPAQEDKEIPATNIESEYVSQEEGEDNKHPSGSSEEEMAKSIDNVEERVCLYSVKKFSLWDFCH